jgi:hypothetical protein
MEKLFSPQICHMAKSANSENGGFLRFTADTIFVARTALWGRFFTYSAAK